VIKIRSKIVEIGSRITPKTIKKQTKEAFYSIRNIYKYGKADMFRNVEIETTTICNRRCSWCPNSRYQREQTLMGEELYKKIINQLAEIKFDGRVSPHFYGEPLTDKRLPELIRYTRKMLPRARIEIFSNGDLLTKELYYDLIKAGVDFFTITQHGNTMAETMKDLLNSLTTEETKKRIYYKVLNEDSPLKNRGGLIEAKHLETTGNCVLPSETVIIDYKGNAILCCNDYLSSKPFGNINEEKLMDIWKKTEYKKIRNELKKGRFRLDICKKCMNITNNSEMENIIKG